MIVNSQLLVRLSASDTALAIVTRQPEHAADATPSFVIASYVLSIIQISSYLLLDYCLTRAQSRVALGARTTS